MTPERRHRVMELLTLALDAAAPERTRVLHDLAEGDSGLRREVASLLELEGEAEGFLPTPAVKLSEAGAAELDAGTRIGPYRVTGVIGRGGMGTICRAVREDDFEIEVAIKLIRHDFVDPRTVRRFQAERQILARLEHPSIARLLDGGTADDGRAYLVMEYVDGKPIDEFCDGHRLSVTQRLELFCQVADAVACAHQSLVVHRDLKPGNVLVTREGVPKLLDFGIAKLLDPGAEQGGLTAGGGMTPRYASPEQVLGEPVTTASDVYALGVLLYELLTGRLPGGLDVCDYQEIPRRILEQDPQRPSSATASIRLPRDGDPKKLHRRLTGDVDAIVLRALRKEPRHRYASVDRLAEDLRRHLEGRPVRARKGTWSYRAGKLARRHKGAVAAVAAVVILSVTSTVLWRRTENALATADRQRSEAVRERVRSDRISEFMQGLFRSANPDAARGETLTVREILDQGRGRLVAGLDDEPELRAALAATLGDVYRNLGLYDPALELLEDAVRLRLQSHPEGHPDLVVALNNLASVYYYLGDWAAAESRFREALEMRRRLGQQPEAIALALNNLASTFKQEGRYGAAGVLYREALAIREKIHPADDPAIASCLYDLGALYYEQGDFERAAPPLSRALEIRAGVLGEKHTQVATVANTLGRVLLAAGDVEQAEALQRRALAIRRELLGPDHPQVACIEKDLAEALLARGDLEAAGELLAASLETLRGSKAPGWVIADAEGAYGSYLTARCRYREAEPYVRSALAAVSEAKGESSIRTRQARERLAALYQAWGRPPPAITRP